MNRIKTSIKILLILAISVIIHTGCFDDDSESVGSSAPNNVNLTGISLSAGSLSPQFNKYIRSYNVKLPLNTDTLTVTPTSESQSSIIIVNNSEVISSGQTCLPIELTDKSYQITIEVIADDDITSKTYTVTVMKIYNFNEYYYGYIDGTYARTAGEYLEYDPSITSGVYRIKPFLVESPFNVYCDMTTDGGGWMMVGFLGSNVSQDVMFSDYGTIETNFSENYQNGLWSIDINNNLLKNSEPLTEMAITLDYRFPTISDYEASDKAIYFKWGTHKISNIWSIIYETGTFSVKLNAADTWDVVTSWAPSSVLWDPRLKGISLIRMYGYTSSDTCGFLWGSAAGGDNSWKHYGYVWVR